MPAPAWRPHDGLRTQPLPIIPAEWAAIPTHPRVTSTHPRVISTHPHVISTNGRNPLPHNMAVISSELLPPPLDRDLESKPTPRFLTVFEMTEHRAFDCAG